MMGFGSSGIKTTSSWSLWKTTREFIEKARRAAMVDGGLSRSANPGRDPTVNHHAQHTQAQIGASLSTPSHAMFYPSNFFLSCYGKQKENGEQRERTEKERRVEEKKLKREKISGKMKDKGKKKKKKLK
jgi:hypothetical protein